MWASTGSRLWDRAGVEWEDTGEELTRTDAEAMMNQPDVEVAISVGTASLSWLDGAERRRVWRDEVAPNFHDQPGWRPPPSAPGQLPYHATLWRNDDRRLVLITDFD